MSDTAYEAPRQLLCLPLEGLYYGFELGCILETVSPVQITPLPCLPACYRGVCSRKGVITPVVSLEGLVEKGTFPPCSHPIAVLVKSEEYECGILSAYQPVILDVSHAQPVRHESVNLPGPLCKIQQILAVDEKIVLVVDLKATLKNLVVFR